MFKKFLKKKQEIQNNDNERVLIISLLIHAARIDENYTDSEKNIISKAIVELYKIEPEEAGKLMELAEKKEGESNQIVEFTREIKKYTMKFRLKIIEIIWKIVYSDGTNDNYESNLIRRICGLLYISDKDSGIIKNKIKNMSK